jgi:hypothetical protein
MIRPYDLAVVIKTDTLLLKWGLYKYDVCYVVRVRNCGTVDVVTATYGGVELSTYNVPKRYLSFPKP